MSSYPAKSNAARCDCGVHQERHGRQGLPSKRIPTNREQHLGARVLVWRFVGAILLMAAILMVLLDYGR